MRRWCTLLGIAFGPWVIALAYVLLAQGHTAAYNSYVNEYRKWPWRAGTEHNVSGGCGGIFKNICLPA